MSSSSDLAPKLDADDRHLKRLSFCHHLMAAVHTAAAALLAWHYQTLQHLHFVAPPQGSGSSPKSLPEEAWFLVSVIYLVLGSFIIILAILNVLSAIMMARRHKRLFSMITAGLNCVSIPLGLALGTYTIIVLCRNRVRAKYDQAEDESLEESLV